MASRGFPADRPEQARGALEAFLSGHRPVPTPTIAAPGLSFHGRRRQASGCYWAACCRAYSLRFIVK